MPKRVKMTRSEDGKVKAAFREVYQDEPAAVGKTRRKFGEDRALKQKIAIALSKARQTGARVPKG